MRVVAQGIVALADGGGTDAAAEGSASSDASLDANVDGAAPPFCDTLVPRPNLCDDFERATGVGPC